VNIGVLGTGVVGTTIGGALAARGHKVMMGSRTAANEKATAWAAQAGANASHGTFAAAAAHGELVFNCTSGAVSLEALRAAGSDNLRGKILIDVANPLDFSRGMPPSLSHSGNDSLGEQIQRAFPDARVVKALNTINCKVMVEPARVPGTHDVFICGNDAAAKARVTELLRDDFGWTSVVDLGDITRARGTEAYVLMWVAMLVAFGTADFNIRVAR